MAQTAKKTVVEAAKKTVDNTQPFFAFDRINYILMIAGVALIILGFIMMTGGSSKDPNVFNSDMFDPRRLTFSTILILAGFAVEMVAIMKKPKD
jgi:thiosulfate reductase cytochrome b subunit